MLEELPGSLTIGRTAEIEMPTYSSGSSTAVISGPDVSKMNENEIQTHMSFTFALDFDLLFKC